MKDLIRIYRIQYVGKSKILHEFYTHSYMTLTRMLHEFRAQIMRILRVCNVNLARI